MKPLLNLVKQRPAHWADDVIQCWDEDTRNREIRALQMAMRETGLRRGSIITLEDEEHIDTDVGVIDILPVWRWCIAQPLREVREC